jgi:hypothetical protein
MLASMARPRRELEHPTPLRFIFKHPLLLESETSWFILMGVLDLLVTYLLLRTGAAREANPVAEFFLTAGGLRGLIYYKCGAMALIVGIAQVVALKHPVLARSVLIIGIAAHLFVVIYGGMLVLRVAV